MSIETAIELTGGIVRTHILDIEKEKGEPLSLEERLRAACREVSKDGAAWMLSSREQAFLAGIGAVATICSSEDQTRIQQEIRVMQGISAMASPNPIPVDLEALLADAPAEPIGLQKIFDEEYTGPFERR